MTHYQTQSQMPATPTVVGVISFKKPNSRRVFWAAIVILLLCSLYGSTRGRTSDAASTSARCRFTQWMQGQCKLKKEVFLGLPGSFSSPEVVLLCGGDLSSRIYSLCAARTLSEAAGLKLRVMWASDRYLPSTAYSDLFAVEGLDVVNEVDGKYEVPPGWQTWRNVAESQGDSCSSSSDGVSWDRQLSLPDRLYVSSMVDGCTLRSAVFGESGSCHLADRTRDCYRQLHPSPGVRSLLAGLNWSQVRSSRGVLFQSGRPVEPVPRHVAACEHTAPVLHGTANGQKKNLASESQPVSRGSRSLLTSDEGESSQIVIAEPETVEVTEDATSSKEEGSTMKGEEQGEGEVDIQPESPVLAPAESAGSWFDPQEDSAEYVLPKKRYWGGYSDSLLSGVLLWEKTAPKLWPDMDRCEGGAGDWNQDANQTVMAMTLSVLPEPQLQFFVGGGPQKGIDWALAMFHRGRMPQTLGFTTRGLRDLCEGRLENGTVPSWGQEHVDASGLARKLLIYCAQRQLAELLALSQTESLIYTFPSGATEFVTARALGDPRKRFAKREGLCAYEPIPGFKRQRWTQFVDYDEGFGVFYCAMPKVACTTWRLWMRKVKGLPELENPEMVHAKATNGLVVLYATPEPKIIEFLTRPDIFKFTFIRNPWIRILSAYLDKHVSGGQFQNNRRLWNRLFFQPLNVSAIREQPDALLEYNDFITHVKAIIDGYRIWVEGHIAPQADICALNLIKYDFVGRFENLANDAALVAKKMGAEEKGLGLMTAYDSPHKTGSDRKLRVHYDKETTELVREGYWMDIKIPLNNIDFKIPGVLRDVRDHPEIRIADILETRKKRAVVEQEAKVVAEAEVAAAVEGESH